MSRPSLPSLHLQQLLPDLDPSILAALDAPSQQALLTALELAEKQQSADYAAALEAGLSQVPALLRKPVRKMILG